MRNKDLFQPFTRNGKAMLLAYDHGMEHGPIDLIGDSYDPNYILNLAIQGGFTGVIFQKGIAEKYYWQSDYARKIPLIIKVNGKTRITPGEPFSAQNCSVTLAKQLGAKAVGYTIYLGSEKESIMLKTFGQIQEEAHRLGIAAIAWIYPRGRAVDKGDSPEMVSYAARLALELGADAVKIKYSNSEESFARAIKMAGRTKVLLSGGEKLSEENFLQRIKDIIRAGATGVAVGRNIWQREDALVFATKLQKVIWPTANK